MSIIKEEVTKLWSVFIVCQSGRKFAECLYNESSCVVYISCVNHQERSYKVAVCIYNVPIIKEEDIKLRCV